LSRDHKGASKLCSRNPNPVAPREKTDNLPIPNTLNPQLQRTTAPPHRQHVPHLKKHKLANRSSLRTPPTSAPSVIQWKKTKPQWETTVNGEKRIIFARCDPWSRSSEYQPLSPRCIANGDISTAASSHGRRVLVQPPTREKNPKHTTPTTTTSNTTTNDQPQQNLSTSISPLPHFPTENKSTR
jgi:hypothetical protein